MGPTPHMLNKMCDQWFMSKPRPGMTHTFCIHFMNTASKDAVRGLQSFLDMRDYCNAEKKAFDKYKEAKLRSANLNEDLTPIRDGSVSIMDYQMGKV